MASPFTPTTISHSLRQASAFPGPLPHHAWLANRSSDHSRHPDRSLEPSGQAQSFAQAAIALFRQPPLSPQRRSSSSKPGRPRVRSHGKRPCCSCSRAQYEKARLERERIVQMSKGVGKPKVGGPFILKDLDGNVFTEEQLKGKYNFIYFGFTHCPDICPDELDKMAAIIDIIKEKSKGNSPLRSIFVTCDPARDTPEVLRAYLKEFHGDILGLTGTYEQVKNMCKQYRVYFSTPENIKPGEDYLVDHSIYFYLMDPEGDFVECIGRQDTPESAANIILDHIKDWKRQGRELDTSKP
ncbi:hypothetical protein CIHG_06464 [Coccidioides immitis H538.4]|uniref:SenC n=1 Tax=Coccidioides immitis H538.4 TaxID=396776 RepID=A0A0J8RVH5_COCIT|nr:hypothetical protein CIHG_06464 [Coccidioides immitis H538.4]